MLGKEAAVEVRWGRQEVRLARNRQLRRRCTSSEWFCLIPLWISSLILDHYCLYGYWQNQPSLNIWFWYVLNCCCTVLFPPSCWIHCFTFNLKDFIWSYLTIWSHLKGCWMSYFPPLSHSQEKGARTAGCSKKTPPRRNRPPQKGNWEIRTGNQSPYGQNQKT